MGDPASNSREARQRQEGAVPVEAYLAMRAEADRFLEFLIESLGRAEAISQEEKARLILSFNTLRQKLTEDSRPIIQTSRHL